MTAQNMEMLHTSSTDEILGIKPKKKKPMFEEGTKFRFQNKVWIVYRAWRDTATDFREIESNFGDRQVMELHTLQKDALDDSFEYEEMTDKEKMVFDAVVKSEKRDRGEK